MSGVKQPHYYTLAVQLCPYRICCIRLESKELKTSSKAENPLSFHVCFELSALLVTATETRGTTENVCSVLETFVMRHNKTMTTVLFWWLTLSFYVSIKNTWVYFWGKTKTETSYWHNYICLIFGLGFCFEVWLLGVLPVAVFWGCSKRPPVTILAGGNGLFVLINLKTLKYKKSALTSLF